VTAVENFLFATSQNAQTTLRSVCGEAELDELLAEREKINTHLQAIIDQHTDPWGSRSSRSPSSTSISRGDAPGDGAAGGGGARAAGQGDRGGGEYQAAQRLADASAIMAKEPIALQLRFLQTLVEVAAENNSTTIFRCDRHPGAVFREEG